MNASNTYQPARPFLVSLFLFACSILYLFPEVAFNASLVEAAGGADSDPSQLKNVELYGRYISGIGASLLVADLLMKGQLANTWLRSIISFSVIFTLVWPVVFFGQRALIDHYVVDSSTPAERQKAYYAQLLRKAIIANTVKIEGVPFDAEAELTAHDKTFLAMFGGMTFRNDALMNSLDEYKVAIARQYIGDLASKDFDGYYTQYRNLRKEMVAGYQRFDSGVKQYNDAMSGTKGEAEKVFTRIDSMVSQGYGDYQDARNAILRDVDSKSQRLADLVTRHFKYKSRCRDQRCVDSKIDRYNKDMAKLDLIGIEDTYWLIEEEIEYGATHYGSKALAAVVTGGVSLLSDALAAASGETKPTHRYSYTDDPKHYSQRLLPKMSPKLKAQTGYEFGIESLSEFRTHPVTTERVALTLRKEGIAVPSSWKINDRDTIYALVGGRAAEQANVNWDKQIRNQGLSLTPEGDWDDFQRDASVQRKIRQALGDKFYQNPVLLDMNNQQFMQNIIQPAINREAESLIKQLSAQEHEFAEGGSYYESGRSAVRAVTIPPISMGISLFLVLMTTAKLPIKGYQLAVTRKRAMTRKESVAMIIVSAAMILAILLYPLTTANRFTEKETTVSYFLTKMQENSRSGAAIAMKWVMNAQPLIQPIGMKIESQLGYVKGFEDRVDLYKEMDEKHFGEKAKADPSKTFQSIALTVKTKPGKAKVRIMNIGPAYVAGMSLVPGRYDIEVSAPGKVTQRKWHDIPNTAASHTIEVEL